MGEKVKKGTGYFLTGKISLPCSVMGATKRECREEKVACPLFWEVREWNLRECVQRLAAYLTKMLTEPVR